MPDIRSRAACNGCRSRKQKCDEKKPECSRCRQLGSKCTWSKTRKRGPAKGYAEALERRLEETEVAFLRLLLASKRQAQAAAFQDDTLDLARSFRTSYYAQVTVNDASSGSEHLKAAIMNQWERLPLKTSNDIEKWTRIMTSASGLTNNALKIGGETTQPHEFGQTQDAFSGQVTHAMVLGDGQMNSELTMVRRDMEAQVPQRELPGSSVASENEPTKQMNAGQAIPNVPRIVDLPEDFKSQYLW